MNALTHEDLTVAPLARSRLDDILAFLRAQYGDDYYGADRRFFNWQYLDTPCSWFAPQADKGLMPVNAVLAPNGDILAIHAFVPFDAITPWGGQRGVWDEEWINRSNVPGVGQRMAAVLLKAADLYVGFGCNALSENAFKKMGLAFTPEVPRMVMLLQPAALYAILSENGMSSSMLDPSATVFRGSGHATLGAAADMDASLFAARAAETRCGPERNARWVAWRYDRHPFISYLAVSPPGGSEQGAAIIRIERLQDGPGAICRIVDIYYGAATDEQLLAAILSAAAANGCLLADYFCTSTASAERLARAAEALGQTALRNPDIPYMFQPLAMGTHNSFNAIFATGAQASAGIALADVLATKADSTQDIERHPQASGI